MLVKLLNVPDELIERIRKITGRITASKAVMAALEDYVDLIDTNNKLFLKIHQLEEQVAVANQVIHGARSAASLLLEKTAQGDLL